MTFRPAAFGLWVTLAAAVVLVAAPTTARAEWRPDGTFGGGPLVHDGEIGAAGIVDLWEPIGPVRLGGALGVAAFPAEQADDSTVFMPAGVSLGLVWQKGAIGLDARLRAGAWAGATNDGLSAGGWVAAGAYVEYVIDPNVALAAGTDVWRSFGEPDAFYVVPMVGLVWTVARD